MGTPQQLPVMEPTWDFPPSADGLRVSEGEYWETYYEMSDRVYEWNNGVLEEKPMADYQSFEMYDWFYVLLREYLKTHPEGKSVGLEIGFRLAIPGNTSIRKPDLAVVLNTNPVSIKPVDRTYKGIFDICFEFLSDSTPDMVHRDTVIKKSEYCRSGVKEYFILDRKGNETAFYRLHGKFYTKVRPDSKGIIRSHVLPSFQFRLDDLYRRPSEIKMAKDPVYRSFVRKDYQEANQRAEKAEQQIEKERLRAERAERQVEKERLKAETERMKAEQRAEEERMKAEQRAEEERMRAEKLVAKLRELGMDPDCYTD